MRVLVMGAGAVGGYYRGRLAQSGHEVIELGDLTGAVVRRRREVGVGTPTSDALYAVLRLRAQAFNGLS